MELERFEWLAYSDAEQEDLFSGTATRIYRLS